LLEMAGGRASIFEEPEELDVSGFAPKGPPIAAPPAAQVRAVSEAAKFPSREAQTRPPASAPKREPRRYRTGRNVQFNMKASQEAVEAFYAVSDTQGWVLGETLEHAVAALQRELSGKSGAGVS
jgi:hypothetical protein